MSEKKSYSICCGYGDLFMVMPMLEQMDHPVDLHLLEYYFDSGIMLLMRTLLPHVKMIPTENKDLKKPYLNHIYRLRSRVHRYEHLSLSDQSIAKIRPFMLPRDYIVVHTTSMMPNRRYPLWSKVDWTGMKIYSVGNPEDNLITGMTQPIYQGNFFEVSRLLRGSRGLLCVDSCVMNLAKAFKVPTLTIFPSKSFLVDAPIYGRSLVNPSPEEVRETAMEMFFRD